MGDAFFPPALTQHQCAEQALGISILWRGMVRPVEGQVLKWVRPADMGAYAMPAADLPLVAMLRDFL